MGKQSKHMKHKGIFLCDLRKALDETKAAKALDSDLQVRTLGLPPRGGEGAGFFSPRGLLTLVPTDCARVCVPEQGDREDSQRVRQALLHLDEVGAQVNTAYLV